MSDTLYLSLKKEWYNMIESGVKTKEYREITPYWIKRLTTLPFEPGLVCSLTKKEYFYPNREEDAGDLFIEEEVEERCMTYYEVAMWLTEKPHRQYKSVGSTWIYSSLNYYEENGKDEADDLLIRENGGEWHKPMITE